MNNLTRSILIILTLLFAATNANAVLTIEIEKGVKRGVPIAIVPFGNENDIDVGYALHGVVRNDLNRTGRFDVKDPKDYLDDPTTYQDIKFGDWQLILVDYLLIGSVTPVEEGHYRIETRLFDVFEEKQVFGSQYLVTSINVRETLHEISNAVYENVTGNTSSFNTKILYTTTVASEQGDVIHKLFIADYDGYNPAELLASRSPILSPSWSPDAQKIAYSLLQQDQSRVWIQEITTGQRSVVAEFEGENRSPSWSPDGTRLAFSISKGGNSDIYVLTLDTGELLQLTKDRRIDTEPSWSPDGEYIVFTSNRGARAQIYRVRAGTNQQVRRITFDGRSNSGASYSSSGQQLILITDQGQGNQVAIYEFDTNAVTVVSSTSIDDSATFSPHGDMLMYVAEGQDRHIKILSPDGSVQSRIETAEGAVKQVAWRVSN